MLSKRNMKASSMAIGEIKDMDQHWLLDNVTDECIIELSRQITDDMLGMIQIQCLVVKQIGGSVMGRKCFAKAGVRQSP